VALLARYAFHLAGVWRRSYVVSAVIALYLNVFVLIVQLFLKVPTLQKRAPTQSEPPCVSENASATEPASLLAVFVADDGARLTSFDQ